jgi:glycine oxidase
MSAHADVVVIGGGVIGLATAWLAATGGRRVTLVDPQAGESAALVAAGMLAPLSETWFGEEPLLRLNLLAAQRFPEFVSALEAAAGTTVGLRREGTLSVALDAGDRAVLARSAGLRRSLGLPAEELDARACRKLEPFLTADVQGGLLSAGDWSVDNRRYLAALGRAAEAAGVVRVTGRVAGVDGPAVVLANGSTIAADAVVLAAGAWSGGIAGVPEAIGRRVRPVKGQLLRLRPTAGLPPVLTHTLRGTVRGADVYLVPRDDGEIVVGATAEERGFDRTVTAGAVHDLLRDALALLPVLGELELAEVGVGLRPGTPDNGPILGVAGSGLIVATGHYRNGVLLSAATAEAVLALLDGGSPAAPWQPFGLEVTA